MDIWTVENGELTLYKRTGECNQCGQCCCNNRITYSMQVGFDSGKREDEDETAYAEHDWSDREGWSMFIAQGIWWYFKIHSFEHNPDRRCTDLDEDNHCQTWQDETFRPICRYWPFHPDDIENVPECSFRFERKKV